MPFKILENRTQVTYRTNIAWILQLIIVEQLTNYEVILNNSYGDRCKEICYVHSMDWKFKSIGKQKVGIWQIGKCATHSTSGKWQTHMYTFNTSKKDQRKLKGTLKLPCLLQVFYFYDNLYLDCFLRIMFHIVQPFTQFTTFCLIWINRSPFFMTLDYPFPHLNK